MGLRIPAVAESFARLEMKWNQQIVDFAPVSKKSSNSLRMIYSCIFKTASLEFRDTSQPCRKGTGASYQKAQFSPFASPFAAPLSRCL